MTTLLHASSSRYLIAVPVVACLVAACGGADSSTSFSSGGAGATAGLTHGGAGGAGASAAGGVLNGASGGASGRRGVSSGGASSGGASSGGASSGGGVSGKGGASSGGGVSGKGGVSSGGGVSGKGGVSSGGGVSGKGGSLNHAGSANDAGSGNDAGDTGVYDGPTVGTAKTFAVLAYSAVTAANISKVKGEIGVSAGAVSTITGFDAPADIKYGIDSLAPNSQRTMLAQQDVTKLVGNIDPRACDADYTNVVGGLTGDITLYPGVTCMNSFSADVLLNGHLTLDARGDSNAFFIIRGKLTLTVADAAQVVLANGAEACGVFWRFCKQVTIGKTVKFYGTVIAGSAVTMNTGSTLLGRALAQTANVSLDANSVTIPTDGLVGAPGVCTHLQ